MDALIDANTPKAQEPDAPWRLWLRRFSRQSQRCQGAPKENPWQNDAKTWQP
jgi:hypothetical protein